jgi:hypothetical protein
MGAGNNPKRVVFTDLAFNTVEVGFGQHTDNCGSASITCGRFWAGFNTNNQPITGDFQYFEKGKATPTLEFYAPADQGSYLAAHQQYLWARYNVGADLLDFGITNTAYNPNGSISCGSPKPKIKLANIDWVPDLDLAGGKLIHICP